MRSPQRSRRCGVRPAILASDAVCGRCRCGRISGSGVGRRGLEGAIRGGARDAEQFDELKGTRLPGAVQVHQQRLAGRGERRFPPRSLPAVRGTRHALAGACLIRSAST